MKVMLVEPPKETWFVMGEYLPPPLGILQLASYLKANNEGMDIQVLDCQAQGIDWKELEERIQSYQPDVFAPSALATCNVYTCARAIELAKNVSPETLTVVGGQHFTALPDESLNTYKEIDVVVRGEGEESFSELIGAHEVGSNLADIRGISFRHDERIIHNESRPLIPSLDELPLPGYEFVEDFISKYHFKMMAGPDAGYAMIEGSRGCPHRCSFCSQWKYWTGVYRAKSPRRIAEEMEFCYQRFGIRFIWLTDDNFGLNRRTEELCDEIIARGLQDEIMWFMQARADDILKNRDLVPKMQRAGNHWILVGLESGSTETMNSYGKTIDPGDSKAAMDVLKQNDVFAQATFIIGERKDTHESMQTLRRYVEDVNPDLSIFMVLTPFPGTDLYDEANRNGWIEETNWANYDMIHAIMPTETLSRMEVQEELYHCYRGFYGSMGRRLKGLFSRNPFKRRTYRHLASQGLLIELRKLFG
jgi:anaerobic magnesium-protoporphyrin IX monomethyl ester cyclase